ncbi:hypothetical protein FSP39_010773 [Pinctada imbricata]|uniref:Uncharacterized protein n=1 Tax=Pinctada imbricata TaxID=66713 RepID=A0AA89C0G7_PINIB|nr:hypothetical protein FSP39_010773 [Pinctada imbricata]
MLYDLLFFQTDQDSKQFKSNNASSAEISYCPLRFCGSMDKRLRRHVMTRHFPSVMGAMAVTPIDVENQLECLTWLVKTVFGPTASYQDAVDWINKNKAIPQGVNLDQNVHDEIYAIACAILGVEAVEFFTVRPINSPGVLLFWRCILALLTQCTEKQCETFRSLKPDNILELMSSFDQIHAFQLCEEPDLIKTEPSDSNRAEPPSDNQDLQPVYIKPEPVDNNHNESPDNNQAEPSDDHDLDDEEFVILDEDISDGSESSVRDSSESSPERPEAFDSLFHLDQMCLALWKSSSGFTVEDVISYSKSCESLDVPSLLVNVVGGVIVYSEPSSYPESNFKVEGPWKVALGVHPKLCDNFNTAHRMKLVQLMTNPKVVALGECGLDRTVPVSKWSKQEQVFRRMLSLAKVDQPLILHLHGVEADEYGSDVHSLCLIMMEQLCQREQKVHIHNFTGKEFIVKAWLTKFPNVLFGLTAKVGQFDAEQIAGLRAIPQDKILLETGSPDFSTGEGSINTPSNIGETAVIVSGPLEMHPYQLLKLTVRNGRALYGI